MTTTVTVCRITNKSVNTKFGPKQTFSFQGDDGEWYKTGFTKPRFGVGDKITFEYTVGAYGNDVNNATVVLDSKSFEPTASKGVPKMPSPTTPMPTNYAGRNRQFPIPALDAERAIIRQNALTNAREVFTTAMGIFKTKDGMPSNEDIASTIIELARKFEAYSAGDLDTAAAMNMLNDKEEAVE